MRELLKMELHETLTPSCNCNLEITRVPGGWIYSTYIENRGNEDGKWHTVFVPFTTKIEGHR